MRVGCPAALDHPCAGSLLVERAGGAQDLAQARYRVAAGATRGIRLRIDGPRRDLEAPAFEDGRLGLKTTIQTLRLTG